MRLDQLDHLVLVLLEQSLAVRLHLLIYGQRRVGIDAIVKVRLPHRVLPRHWDISILHKIGATGRTSLNALRLSLRHELVTFALAFWRLEFLRWYGRLRENAHLGSIGLNLFARCWC